MKITGRYIALALGVACLVPVGRAAGATEADPPYAVIASRNIFGLMPVPTNNPAEEAAALADLPKITPNGIMSIFGKLQVLFKVAVKPVTGQPNNGNKDDSYVMCVGERQDEIEVVKIDEAASIVTFNNHGTVQELPLVAASPTGPGAGPSGPGGPGGRGGNPGFAPHFTPGKGGGLAAPMGMDNHGQRGPTVGGNPGSSGTGLPSFGGNSSTGFGNSSANNQAEALTPEAQVLLMEKNRLDTQDEVIQGKMPPLPPTPITPEDAVGVGGVPLVKPPSIPGQE
jgi:hypothetical protein